MPVIDIPSAKSKLVGVCCLQGEERDLVKRLWEKRFSGLTAFFTDASPEDSARRIAKRINSEVTNRGFQGMAGLDVIFVVFLDLREDVSENLLQALASVPGILSANLGCNVLMRLNFGFVDTQDDEGRETLPQRIKDAVQSDMDSRGLYLVAEPDFGGRAENHWKAVMVYLDLLRRGAESAQSLAFLNHDNGTIGFLRYGEYGVDMLSSLQKEYDELTAQLATEGNDGGAAFSTQLTSGLMELETAARAQFAVNGAMQPIHPDMTVTGRIAQWQAAHGSNQAFNKAQLATQQALLDTGKRMEQQIQDFYQARMQDPKTFLIGLFQKANVRLKFVENSTQVLSYLDMNDRAVPDAALPTLAYNPNGYTDQISLYLADKLAHCLYKAKKNAMESLRNAYNSLSQEKIAKERTQMRERLDVVKTNLGHLPTREKFCALALGNGAGLESAFSVFLGAAGDMTLKHLVCRRQDDRTYIQNNCVVHGTECRYYIDEAHGGLGELDNAPIKALQAALFDCTDARLEDILDL